MPSLGVPGGTPPSTRSVPPGGPPWFLLGGGGGGGGLGFDRDPALATPARAELHRAGVLGVHRVVATEAGARAGVEAGAALADDDLAAGHGLAGEDLHAEALGLRVTAVAAGAEALLVCHVGSISR